MGCRALAAFITAAVMTGFGFGIATAGTDQVDLVVAGNRHIGADQIRSYFHATAGGAVDDSELDAGLKRLYQTGLFQDAKIVHDGGHTVVQVVENPTIKRLAFEGNKQIKDADLKKDMQSKEGGPLSREFVQSDVVHMIALYRAHGYYGVRIIPQTINRDGHAGAKPGIGGAVKAEASPRVASTAVPETGARHQRGQVKGSAAGQQGVDLVFEINEGDKLAVRQIEFSGNTAFSGNKLKGVIKSGQSNVLSFLLNNDIYDADKIEADRDLLRQFYLAHGYADVRVTTASHYDVVKKGVVLTFTMAEGPQYRVGKVDVESTIKSVNVSALRSSVRTQPGEIYDAGAVNKSVDALTMQLAKSGDPFASVIANSDRQAPAAAATPSLAPGAPARLINLVYTAQEGPHVYIDRIEIHGNTKTHDEVIRREFDFAEGDAYNRDLVQRAETRLKRLGYFKTVTFTTKPGSAPDRVILDVAVEEQGTGNFSIAGGYSTSEGLLAQVSVSDSNMLGTGLIGKASVTWGQYAEGFDLGITDPYFLDQRVSAGIDLFDKETIANSNQSYNSAIYGAKVSLGTPLNDQLGVSWNYSIYNQGLSLDPSIGTASLPIQQAAAAGPLWVSSVGNSVTYSTVDNVKNPTSGIRVQFNNDLAGLGGATKFARTTEDFRAYHPIVGDVVGMVRAQGGYITPWGGQQLPLLDGFFGGPQLVRGFAPNGFGPRDVTPGTTMDNIGGNAYWTTSAELQAPVPGIPADANLKVALFSDVGSLWATGASGASSLATLSPAQQIANSKAPRASVGTGLIWDSPFGAMEVDYAYPLLKQPFDVTQRLQFTAGGF